jgi:hypothetical protein
MAIPPPPGGWEDDGTPRRRRVENRPRAASSSRLPYHYEYRHALSTERPCLGARTSTAVVYSAGFLRLVVSGFYNYYIVPTSWRALNAFYWHVAVAWRILAVSRRQSCL